MAMTIIMKMLITMKMNDGKNKAVGETNGLARWLQVVNIAIEQENY